MTNLLAPFLSQLAGQSPLILVYLVGIVLALIYWQRCPLPSVLTLIASGLLLLTLVGQTFVNLYLVHMLNHQNWPPEQLGWMFSGLALTSNLLRTLAFGLLLTAVFIGRPPRWEKKPA